MAIELCEPAAGRAAKPPRGAEKLPLAFDVAGARVFVISNNAVNGENFHRFLVASRTGVPAKAGQFFNIEPSATAEPAFGSTIRGLRAIKDRGMHVDKVEALA